MKFTSSHQTWNRGINAVQNAVGSPISNPIVENIHISCENDQVRFLATNLNLTIRCEGEATIEEPGQIVIPAKLITNIVRDLPKEEVHFEATEDTVKIKCGKFNAKLKGQSGELFPPFVSVEEGDEIVIPAEKLKDLVRKTIFSTSQEKSRFELDGVKFDLTEAELKAIATDGRRLAMVTPKDIKLPEKELSVLVPTKTLQEVQNSLPDEGDVSIKLQERKIQFSCGDATVISNLLVDNFPQYDRIIPPEGEIKIKVNRSSFASAAKRAANLASTETSMLIIHFSPGTIEVLGESDELGGEGKDSISAEYDGEELDVRYNFKYLNDCLRIIDEDEIEIDLKDSRKPGIFKGVGNDSFLYVLMPMRPPDEKAS